MGRHLGRQLRAGLTVCALWAGVAPSTALGGAPPSVGEAPSTDATASDPAPPSKDPEAGAVAVPSASEGGPAAPEPQPEPGDGTPGDSAPPSIVQAIFELPVAARTDPYGPRPGGLPKLSREQIVRYALENPLVGAAKAQVEAMEAQARKARWAWFPIITASATISPGVSIRCDDVTLQQANGDAFDFQYCRSADGDGDDLDVQTVRGYLEQLGRAGVAVRLQADFILPIYTFGKLLGVRKMAEIGVAITKLEVQATRQETRKRVAEAYAGLLLARESIRILEEGWRLLQRERGKLGPADDDGEDWESGLGDEDAGDPKAFIKLEVGEIELARRMREARKLEALALSALWTLAGEAAPEGFDVRDQQLRPRRVEGGLRDLRHYQELARDARPEAKMAEGLVDVRREAEKLARRNFLPDLGLAVSARYSVATSAESTPALYYTGRPNSSAILVGLGLRWNLDFHNKAFDLQRAAAQTRRAAHQRDAAKALLDLEVEQAYRDYRGAVDDAVFAAMARDKSWQLVVSEQQRSTVGEPDFDALRKALIEWAEYEFEHFEALQAQNVALAKLERATGSTLAAIDRPSRPGEGPSANSREAEKSTTPPNDDATSPARAERAVADPTE